MENKKELTNEEYKKVLLETLDASDSFCRKNKINYFLSYGTLLGAIRHKGFIPWDDDIDVGMPQKDYERFKKLYKNNDNFYFIDCFTSNDYYLPFGKFCSQRVDLHENINTRLHIGAYIDIFPYNFVKNSDSKKLEKFLRNDSVSKRIIDLKYATLHGKGLIQKIAICFCNLIYPFSLNHISRRRIEKSRKFISETETSLFGNLFDSIGINELSDYKNFKECIEVEFEGKKYFAPAGYDSYLSNLYHDYMSLPPVEKRIAHHAFEAYWKE